MKILLKLVIVSLFSCNYQSLKEERHTHKEYRVLIEEISRIPNDPPTSKWRRVKFSFMVNNKKKFIEVPRVYDSPTMSVGEIQNVVIDTVNYTIVTDCNMCLAKDKIHN